MNLEALRALRHELSHRTVRSARELLRDVEEALSAVESQLQAAARHKARPSDPSPLLGRIKDLEGQLEELRTARTGARLIREGDEFWIRNPQTGQILKYFTDPPRHSAAYAHAQSRATSPDAEKLLLADSLAQRALDCSLGDNVAIEGSAQEWIVIRIAKWKGDEPVRITIEILE